MTQIIQTPKQQTYLAKLLDYDYTIEYRSGSGNAAADALSRVPPQGQCLTLSFPTFEFLGTLYASLLQSPGFLDMRNKVRTSPNDYPDYTIHRDLLFYHNKLWLPSDCSFIPSLLEEFHSTLLGGHTGIAKTFRHLHANFYWEGMHRDTHRFVSQCTTCQKTKYETKRAVGLLQPLSIPSGIWEDISMDFIIDLPPSHNYTTILVVVDHFSKGAHFGTLPPPAHRVQGHTPLYGHRLQAPWVPSKHCIG